MQIKVIKILVICDSKDNLVTLKALIKNNFSEALILTSLGGQQGLEIAAAEEPDIIILEIIMPGIGGLEVCTRIKADKKLRDIPVVLVNSIKGEKDNKIKALKCGAEAFLSEPIDEVELDAQIRAMIKIRAANIQKRDESQFLAALVEEKTRELKDLNIKSQQLLEDVMREKSLIEAIFDSVPGYLYVYDESGRLIKWNKKHETMTGFTAEELPYMTLDKWFGEEDIVKVNKSVYEVFHKGYGEVEAQLILKNGEKMLVRSSGVPLIWEGNKYFVGIGVDITEHKRIEDELKQSEKKYRLITENVSDVISVYNLSKNKFTYISPSIFNLRGVTVEEGLRENFEDAILSDSIEFVKDIMSKNMNDFLNNPNTKNNYINEIRQPCKNGETIWVEVSTKHQYNTDGELEAISISRNIDERKKSEEIMTHLSYYDQLTNVYNRRFYEEELKRLDTERNIPITLIMADVNGLKFTNDAFGHQTGDILLQTIAEILKKECSADEIISRIGGDEFVILLPKCDDMQARLLINRINIAILKEKEINPILSLSIGYAVKEKTSQNMNEIFKKAEDDMYRHKISESLSMRSKTIDLIMNSLFEKSSRERHHSDRVGSICESIALNMNFNKDEIQQIKISGLLHDLGKIGISDSILNKEGKLDEYEWREMKKHPEIGYRILSPIYEFSEISEYVLSHQERWDGKGYPQNLKYEEIPIEARIIAVADAFDAMTEQRSYRNVMSETEAIIEIRKCAGTQFDPEIARIFIEKVMNTSW